MKRILVWTLLLTLLCAPFARAEIGGEGWWDDDYDGYYVRVEGTDLCVKVPSGWTDVSAPEEAPIYRAPDTYRYFDIYVTDLGFWDDLMGGGYDEYAQESAYIILQQDRDWFIIEYTDAEWTGFTPCGGDSGTVIIEFTSKGTDLDQYVARRVISSIKTLD